MMSAPVVLYADPFWVSPYVFSSFVALREKDLAFEVVTIDLSKGEHRREPFRSSSLTARVPALDDHGFWLSESNAIAEYLEEAYPPPEHRRLFPADPRQRARARQMMAFLRTDLGPLRDERPSEMVFYQMAGAPLSEPALRSARKLIDVAEQLIARGLDHRVRRVVGGGRRPGAGSAPHRRRRRSPAGAPARLCREPVGAAVGAGVRRASARAVRAI